MQFNKNTIVLSKLDSIAHSLNQKGYKPRITLIEKIEGRGNNDLIPYNEKRRVHYIRRMEYLDQVILEQFIATNDIEIDDYIISYEFHIDKTPKDWKSLIQR